MPSLDDGLTVRSMRHRDRHGVIHEFTWTIARFPFTRCRNLCLPDDPSPTEIARGSGLVVNCVGCLADLGDG